MISPNKVNLGALSRFLNTAQSAGAGGGAPGEKSDDSLKQTAVNCGGSSLPESHIEHDNRGRDHKKKRIQPEGRTPEIRFAGFTGDWRTCKFGNSVSFLRHNSLSRAELTTSKTKAMNIHYGDILVKFGATLNPQVDSIPFVRCADVNNLGDPLSDGDVVFADAAEDLSVGKCTEIQNVNNVKVFSGLHTIPARPLEQFAAGFLGYALSSDAFRGQLFPLVQGTKVSSISASALSSCNISYPVLAEQRVIGGFFRELDELIAASGQQLVKLGELKTAMLTKMFPRPGERAPELRFTGFTGDWELETAANFMVLQRGLTYTPHDVVGYGQGVRVLRSSNIVEDTFAFHDDDVFVRHEAVSIPYAKSGEVLITASNGSSGLVGKRALIKDSSFPSVHGGFMLKALDKNDMNDFLNALLGSNWYRSFLNQFVAGGGGAIGNLDATELLNRKVYVPSLTEQQAIGGFFRELDAMIEGERLKLAKLKQLRAAFLQKMFA